MSEAATRTGIGQPVRRKEDARLLTGRGAFSDDLDLPGQAYAVFVRSPHAHARVRAIDVRRAASTPGVFAVLTGEDLLADGLKPLPHLPLSQHPAEIRLANRDGSPLFSAPHYPLACDKVRFVGEALAVVVARSVATAKDAAEQVEVDYDVLPAVTDTVAAAAPDAPRVWEEAGSNVCLDAESGERAATEAAFARAAHVVRFSTVINRVTGVTMEPRAALAQYDPAQQRYTLHAGSGGAVRLRDDLATVLDVAAGKVRVVMRDIGGNFGTRGMIYRVEVVVGTVSNGQGHETSFAQLVTEWLGVALEQVEIIAGDTDVVKVGGGTHSGRGMRLISIVVFNASRQIIDKGRRIAARLFECDPSRVTFGAGRFSVAESGRALGLFEVAAAAEKPIDLPQDLRGPLTAFSDETVTVASFPYGCHVCEVEVDPELGTVEIVRYVAVDDAGRAVNPMIVHGQTHGGIAQGVGQALLEHCYYDPRTGQLLAGSFMDYSMPRADHFPFFVTHISEVPSTTHPLGLRPAGEGGTTPALGVTINAVVDALADFGVRHVEMPATPERVWRAIREAGRR